MAAMTPVLRTAPPNRRRRVRHKVQTPAYASFTGDSKSAVLDLHEIVDISEDGVAIQCSAPLELDRRIDLCLDLAEATGSIYTTGKVIWSGESGRSGFRFSGLAPDSLLHLREWLFLNAMAGVANAEAEGVEGPHESAEPVVLRPNYTDTLAAVTTVQRQVESLGPDLGAALRLIAVRSEALVRASGAAIALVSDVPDTMVCRATSGPDAPPVGAPLQVGSGFSGACVREGRTLRCDDTETDARVDRESCRALGIRSILATPVRIGEKVIGLLEVFSRRPGAFTDDDNATLQRLAETVLAAVNRAARAEDLEPPPVPCPVPFTPPTNGVLFASQPEKNSSPGTSPESASIRLPRSYLVLLYMAAAAICGALGYGFAPMIEAKLKAPVQGTVLASSRSASASTTSPPVASGPSVATANVEQLRHMAEEGDAVAQNALGLHYATGEGVKLDETEAVRWFTKAAEQGNVSAQSKLGSLYWAGRGLPANLDQAYFWTVLARAGGDAGSKALAPVLESHMTQSNAADVRKEAELWLQEHSGTKPPAGR